MDRHYDIMDEDIPHLINGCAKMVKYSLEQRYELLQLGIPDTAAVCVALDEIAAKWTREGKYWQEIQKSRSPKEQEKRRQAYERWKARREERRG